MNALKAIRQHKYMLTKQQYRTLKGQAIAGDHEGALKGLDKLLRRYQDGRKTDVYEKDS